MSSSSAWRASAVVWQTPALKSVRCPTPALNGKPTEELVFPGGIGRPDFLGRGERRSSRETRQVGRSRGELAGRGELPGEGIHLGAVEMDSVDERPKPQELDNIIHRSVARVLRTNLRVLRDTWMGYATDTLNKLFWLLYLVWCGCGLPVACVVLG
jgi:hypothetical protein